MLSLFGRKSTIGLLSLVALLTACTGDNSTGGGQTPDPAVLDIPIAYIKRSLPAEDDDNDPTTPDIPVPMNVMEPANFHPGASLWLRDRASPSATERNITARLIGVDPAFISNDPNFLPEQYDVKDLSPSWDGKKIVFALRAPQDPNLQEDDPDQPSWNIWEYDIPSDVLRRVIRSNITAEDGHDIAPSYLPDGRIVFSSTRQRKAKSILLDEGKTQFSHMDEDDDTEAFSLHVMDADGTDIKQISFNQSHDIDPSILDNGRIIYSRWDNQRQMSGADSGMHLYTVNSDGSSAFVDQSVNGGPITQLAESFLYGNRSHTLQNSMTEFQFIKPRQLQDGRILTVIKPTESIHYGGDLIGIDAQHYVNDSEPISGENGTGPAQNRLSFGNVVFEEDESQLSPGGRYHSAFPLWDGSGRFLVSWSPCLLIEGMDTTTPRTLPCSDENVTRYQNQPNPCNPPACLRLDPARPKYGIYTYDASARTLLPLVVPDEGDMIHDVIALSARSLPNPRTDLLPDQDLLNENVAALHIRNVYDFDGTLVDPRTVNSATPSTINAVMLADPAQTMAADRPVRFIRLEKAVSIPNRDIKNFDRQIAFGFSGGFMREIIGYVPVEPDGSAKFKIPANIALSLQLLDGEGHRIGPRHNNWLTFMPGEKITCNGCHNPSRNNRIPAPHGRGDAENNSAYSGAGSVGIFPNSEADLIAQTGESMAETWARIRGIRTPTVALEFRDDWTADTVTRPNASTGKEASFSWSYSDFPARQPTDNNSVPTFAACIQNWNAICRITIHYQRHIQAIWNAERPDGAENHKCVSCHNSEVDDGMGNIETADPAGELILTLNQPGNVNTNEFDANFNQSITRHGMSYPQLFLPRPVLLDSGTVIEPSFNAVNAAIFTAPINDNMTPTDLTDDFGDCTLLNPIPGVPIPMTTPLQCGVCVTGTNDPVDPLFCRVLQRTGPLLRANNAAGSSFFTKFAQGQSHYGWLSDGELKMIAEWADIGGQYYNDPFASP